MDPSLVLLSEVSGLLTSAIVVMPTALKSLIIMCGKRKAAAATQKTAME